MGFTTTGFTNTGLGLTNLAGNWLRSCTGSGRLESFSCRSITFPWDFRNTGFDFSLAGSWLSSCTGSGRLESFSCNSAGFTSIGLELINLTGSWLSSCTGSGRLESCSCTSAAFPWNLSSVGVASAQAAVASRSSNRHLSSCIVNNLWSRPTWCWTIYGWAIVSMKNLIGIHEMSPLFRSALFTLIQILDYRSKLLWLLLSRIPPVVSWINDYSVGIQSHASLDSQSEKWRLQLFL